jgi:hypothetical protein
MSTDEVKTFKFTPAHAGVAEIRVRIATAATASDVRLLSLEETRKRSSTLIEVIVAGHPSQIRRFKDELNAGGGGGYGAGLDDLVGGLAIDLVLDPLAKVARERWYRLRGETPPAVHVPPGEGEARTTVAWKWEEMLPTGEGVGPVRVCTYLDEQAEPETTEDWPESVKRTEALAYAQEHGFVFMPRYLPEDA